MEHDLHIPPVRARAVTLALLLATAICLLLLIGRALLTGEIRWIGFFGNLMLAWIPLGFAHLFCSELDRPGRRRWLLGGLFTLWLLFFPNAAYIVTDLIHLKTREPVPKWFDYILITAYAWTGLFLCYVSLRLLHARVQQWWGVKMGWRFVIGMLAAGSFGIYVGRVFRWNSWDMIIRPWSTLQELVRFCDVRTRNEAIGFCATFFLLSVMVYVVLHALAHLHAPVPAPVSDRRE